jgi:hypothetical protein
MKSGRGLRPDQVLELASTGERRWVGLWCEYEAATKGRRAIVWTDRLPGWFDPSRPKFRDVVGLGDEISDEEAATAADAVDVVAVWATPRSVWSSQRARGALGRLQLAMVAGSAGEFGSQLVERSRWGPDPDRPPELAVSTPAHCASSP